MSDLLINSGYLEGVYQPSDFRRLVSRVTAHVTAIQAMVPFDTIAFSGFSGAGLAFPVSFLTGIPLLAVRKDEDTGHHKLTRGVLEGHISTSTYAILDDFISGGSTIRRIVSRIRDKNPMAVCSAIILWNDEDNRYTAYRDLFPDGIEIFSLLNRDPSIWLPSNDGESHGV